MQYRKDRKGNELSILGYGCMRFTKKGTGIDIDKAEKELMTAYRAGVNYYDTAYIYPGSEAAVGEIFERNQIRDKVNIATKLPQYLIGNRAALDRYFDEELKRLRTDHVDYYLMHHLTDVAMWEKLKKVGILDWIQEKKQSGAIRNIGFSYHGNTENFLKIVDDYDWDFCQIQYNYLDEVAQAGKAGLQAAAAKGLAVMIMEPLRGGKLVNMLPEAAKKAMQDSHRDWSPAEWGLRWLYNQPEVTVVLSGMNSVEMVEANCRTASEAQAGQLPHRLGGTGGFADRGGLPDAGEGQGGDPGEGEGGLHRLPLLHAVPEGRGHTGHLPLLEHDVHRVKAGGADTVHADRGSDQGAGLCLAVHPLRQVRTALSAVDPHPG